MTFLGFVCLVCVWCTAAGAFFPEKWRSWDLYALCVWCTAAGYFFFWKNGVPGIFMPCVCVMHCRRRFFWYSPRRIPSSPVTIWKWRANRELVQNYLPDWGLEQRTCVKTQETWRGRELPSSEKVTFLIFVCPVCVWCTAAGAFFSEKMTFLGILCPVCVWCTAAGAFFSEKMTFLGFVCPVCVWCSAAGAFFSEKMELTLPSHGWPDPGAKLS